MYTQSPRTLIHHDVQGDNLLVAGDGEPSLVLVDWQPTAAARPVLDLADFIVAHLDISERRRHGDRLLGIYHSVLIERGVADYPWSCAGMTTRWCCCYRPAAWPPQSASILA